MPLKVLVDGTSVPPHPGGVARYIEQLVAQLADSSDIDVHVVCQAQHAARFSEFVGAARVHAIAPIWAPVPMRLLWEQLVLPGLARKLSVDVIHSPHYTLPLLSGRAKVVTLHDGTFFSIPEAHSRAKRLFFRAWIRISTRRAEVCVTPSKATRDEVIRYVPHVRSAFEVAYSGVDPAVFFPPSEAMIADSARIAGLAGTSWIAFLATIEPRKNLAALVDAFAALWADAAFRTAHPGLVLAIAGADGWGESAVEMIAAVPADVPVRRLGYLPTQSLSGFLGGAMVVAYPSFGEGFGLPVLEAMATSAAVLTTRKLALPEVGGDAVAYSETDAASIASALAGLLADPAERARLGSAGLERSRKFSWASSAAAHSVAYRTAKERRNTRAAR